jgi:DNA-binding FadR family transcriptional regulator
MLENQGEYKPAYRRAVDQLISYIAEQGLRPGDRLPTELELASELGTSQRAVREAIKMLSAIGRVRPERGRGIFVGDDRSLLTGQRPVSFRPTDLGHIAMLFEFRTIQEREAALLAAQRATPPTVKSLEAAVADGQQAITNGDLGLFVRSDDAFHAALAEASQNIFLIDAISHIRSLQGQVSFLELQRNAANADRAVKEHGLILDAVRSGEALLAADRAAEHVRRSLQDYREAIERRLAAAES